MSSESELLWPGAALLLLLGTTAGLCVRCSRPGAKKPETIYEQRSQQENEQNFAVARTYSLVQQVWPGPLMDTASDVSPARKDKLLLFSHLEGSRHDPDAAYVDPIPIDYYNWGRFQKPPEDDDSNSYENVLICKPSTPESGGEDSEDYQNSASIHQWQESRRATGVQSSPVGSPDDDSGEADYVNGDVAAAGKV
ncbi:linker for activation of T-cells family member 2 isoform X2 [Nannospalax galili]|uniref:Linker for activation of T cells family, member 2 n=1 Tax=Nannospalax galili TaxID=1026970 RepID=A0A8C6RFD8_NANGA|nr:linker for activation of T-cells family member 2 isoform X2 [Nannospalax galili]